MNKLRLRREELGMSIEEVAKLTGVGRSTIQRMETTQKSIRSDLVPKLAKALKVDIEYILDIEGDREDSEFKELVYYFSRLNANGRRKILDYSKDVFFGGRF